MLIAHLVVRQRWWLLVEKFFDSVARVITISLVSNIRFVANL